jgi:hypothetical protein
MDTATGPTYPKTMPHVCRKCGEIFPAHAPAVKHWRAAHGLKAVNYCNANCGLKMTYHEVRYGRALYGEASRQKP